MPQWRRLALFAVLLVCGIVLTLVNPQIVRVFIDGAVAGAGSAALAGTAALFLLAAAVRQGVMLATDYVGELIAWKSTNALRADLALHCLSLDLPFHKAHAPGELIERIDGDVSALANYLSRFSLRVLGNVLLVLGTLAVLFVEDARVGIGITLYACVSLALLWRMQNLGVGRWAAERQAQAEYASFLEERLQGTEDIRSSGAEAYVLERLRRLTHAMLGKYRAARLTSNITFMAVQGLYTLAYALGLGAGAWLYLQGQATIGTAYLIVYYVALLAGPIDEIRFQVQNLQSASASVGRVAGLFAHQPTVRDDPKAILPPGPLSVAFDGVTFKYDEANLALDDVTLRVEPGEVLGVLGRTGSGKSTLTRLLFRLYDPLAGVIRLSGTGPTGIGSTGFDIRDVGLADLRDRIALVTQDVQLFEGTVRDNMTLFNRRIGDAQIESALRALGLWEWVQSRQGGLDGKLLPGGQGLSAGEAQLLAFTRAFLKDPGLVVLDEASSRLDPGSERLLEQAVSQLLRGRTGIIIAHHLRTVQRADSIAIFEHGRVVEHRRRVALSRDPHSRFYKLLQAGLEQALEAEGTDDAPATVEPKEVADEHMAI
jgi:ABC-type multidrug transport system fused ATPase/permease subunit